MKGFVMTLAVVGLVVSLVLMFISGADRQAQLDQDYRKSAAWAEVVGIAALSGSLDRDLAVDNWRKSSVYAVSNSLDIDHDSKRQASTRRP